MLLWTFFLNADSLFIWFRFCATTSVSPPEFFPKTIFHSMAICALFLLCLPFFLYIVRACCREAAATISTQRSARSPAQTSKSCIFQFENACKDTELARTRIPLSTCSKMCSHNKPTDRNLPGLPKYAITWCDARTICSGDTFDRKKIQHSSLSPSFGFCAARGIRVVLLGYGVLGNRKLSAPELVDFSVRFIHTGFSSILCASVEGGGIGARRLACTLRRIPAVRGQMTTQGCIQLDTLGLCFGC